MKRLCIICGKNAVIGNFCEDCWLKRQNLFKINDLEIKICSCNSYFNGKTWKHFNSLDNAVERFIKDNIKTKNKIIGKNIKLKKVGNKYNVNIECVGYILQSKKIKHEKKNIVVKITNVKCERCKKLSGNYYESVLQIRTTNSNMPAEIIKKHREDILKVKKVRNGFDIFILKKNIAGAIAKKLKSRGFEIKISNKFLGMKKGKKIYRYYYAVKD